MGTHAERLVIGIGEMIVSKSVDDLLITYALGSCLGFAIYDPEVGVGGLIHLMLPTSTLDKERSRHNPERFVDTGVPVLFKECYRLGAKKERLVARVAGGASMIGNGGRDSFQTGRRNVVTLKKMLWKNGVLLKAEDVGGSVSRTVSLRVATGEMIVKTNGVSTPL